MIKERRPIPYNGCRPPKRRRCKPCRELPGPVVPVSAAKPRPAKRAKKITSCSSRATRCLSRCVPVERRGTAPGQKTTGNKSRDERCSEVRGVSCARSRRCAVINASMRRSSELFSARPTRSGPNRTQFLQLLERRLDNVKSTGLNLAAEPRAARQLVTLALQSHGRIVNPSYVVRAATDHDRAGSLKSPVLRTNSRSGAERRPPEWLEWNDEGRPPRCCKRRRGEQIDTPVDEHSSRYYSR